MSCPKSACSFKTFPASTQDVDASPVLRSDLYRRHKRLFAACLVSVDRCARVLAAARLEGLLLLLGAFDDAALQCWPWLAPRLAGHSSEGCIVAGAGCRQADEKGEEDSGDVVITMCCPQRVAYTADNAILVADWGNGRICRWSAGRGEIFAELQGPLHFTYAVCCDPAGAVYATTEDAVVCMSETGEACANGKLLQEVSRAAGLCDHCGLCPDGHGGLYIADHLNDRIVRIRPPGTVEVALGPAFLDEDGSELRMSCPADVDFSSDGILFVADRASGRVLQFLGDGRAAVLASELAEPFSVASRGDLLYVAEYGSDRLFCLRLSDRSVIHREVQSPTGLCFDTAGGLYVTERDANRVVRFEPVVE